METPVSKEEAGSLWNWEESYAVFSDAIASDREAIKIRALIKLAKASKDVPEEILARTIPQLTELLDYPRSPLSPLIQESSALCLKRIATHREGRLARLIGQSGGIDKLLRLLPHSGDRLKKSLSKCLRSVITSSAENSTVLVSCGGVEVVLNVLDLCPNEIKPILLETLSALALSKPVRRLIFSSRRVHHLVEAARCGGSVSRTRAAQAIGLLGSVKRGAGTLVDSNALPVLVSLLRDGDLRAKLVSANAIGIIISSHTDHIKLVAGLGVIPLYAGLLQNPDPVGKEIAEDVFCLLAVCEENAVPLVEHLVTILTASHEPEPKAAAADVLWDLSSYEWAPGVLGSSGAFPVLAGLLRDGNLEVRERVAGAVAQLSQDGSNRGALADCGVIPILIRALEGDGDGDGDGSEELRDNACEALVNFSGDRLLGDRVSCILENDVFLRMRMRVMQMMEYQV